MPTKRRLKPSVVRYLYKILVVVIITLILLIGMKASSSFKTNFYKYVYDQSFSFTKFNNLYHKYFGKVIKEKTEPVSSDKITYSNISKYEDGAKLSVGSDYAIPIKESGMVVFIGNKDKYNKTVIIQQNNGIDLWYGNIDTVNVKLYDYVTKGSILGNCHDYLYLVFKKNGEVLNYEENI